MVLTYSDIISDPSVLSRFKSRDLVELRCNSCGVLYRKPKNQIQGAIKGRNQTKNFCSHDCDCTSRKEKIPLTCTHCDKEFLKIPSKVSKKNFCSKSCSASYNNKNKTSGTRRSRLEHYLQEVLEEKYPTLEILFNDKSVLGSELDIFIPSLRIAIELNGIYHYEPIHGYDKLFKIQKNDCEKKCLCDDKGIKLIEIDTRVQKRFSVNTSMQFVTLISNIIDEGNHVRV